MRSGRKPPSRKKNVPSPSAGKGKPFATSSSRSVRSCSRSSTLKKWLRVRGGAQQAASHDTHAVDRGAQHPAKPRRA